MGCTESSPSAPPSSEGSTCGSSPPAGSQKPLRIVCVCGPDSADFAATARRYGAGPHEIERYDNVGAARARLQAGEVDEVFGMTAPEASQDASVYPHRSEAHQLSSARKRVRSGLVIHPSAVVPVVSGRPVLSKAVLKSLPPAPVLPFLLQVLSSFEPEVAEELSRTLVCTGPDSRDHASLLTDELKGPRVYWALGPVEGAGSFLKREHAVVLESLRETGGTAVVSKRISQCDRALFELNPSAGVARRLSYSYGTASPFVASTHPLLRLADPSYYDFDPSSLSRALPRTVVRNIMSYLPPFPALSSHAYPVFRCEDDGSLGINRALSLRGREE